MVCPDCGRVLYNGEICQCQKDAVYKRELELKTMQTKERLEKERIEKEEELRKKESYEKISSNINDVKENIKNESQNIIQNYISVIRDEQNIDLLESQPKWQTAIIYAVYLLSSTLFMFLALSNTSLSTLIGGYQQIAGYSTPVLFGYLLVINCIILLSSYITNKKITNCSLEAHSSKYFLLLIGNIIGILIGLILKPLVLIPIIANIVVSIWGDYKIYQYYNEENMLIKVIIKNGVILVLTLLSLILFKIFT